MKITKVAAYELRNTPIKPPPFRKVPSTASSVMVSVETDEGHVGWSRAGFAHPIVVHFINEYVASEIVGEDPLRISRIKNKLDQRYVYHKLLEGVYRSAWSNLDVALWDIKGQALGQPLHILLGGAADKRPLYTTFGLHYGNEPRYTAEELAAEAKYWVDKWQTGLKFVVGRQSNDDRPSPDARDDYRRLAAVRAAVGPDVKLAMDGAFSMTLSEGIKLCRMVEELDIAFFEEPLYDGDPLQLAELRRQTTIPVAVAETPKYSARDLMVAGAVDIMQPNVTNDGGYTGAMAVASIAQSFNIPVGHGNGSGPHNLPFQAGVANGSEIEVHYPKWMAYTAIFQNVPQPAGGFIALSTAPGTGLVPKPGIIDEYAVKR